MWQKYFAFPKRRPAVLLVYVALAVLLFASFGLVWAIWPDTQSPTTEQVALLPLADSMPDTPVTVSGVVPTESGPEATYTSDPAVTPTASTANRQIASRGERSESEPTAISPTPEPTTVTPAAEATSVPTTTSSLSGKRVGLQVGHWQCANLPAEFASLRTSTGGSGGGYREVDLNLKVARLVATMLQEQGLIVDIIPSTVPVKYQADAFVAIHADANNSSGPRGFKLARSGRSAIPTKDNALVAALYDEYGQATGLPRSSAITNNMVYYYAFNSGAQHTVAATTPAAIMEMGYLTNPTDRSLIVNSTEIVAKGIAQGIMSFLAGQ